MDKPKSWAEAFLGFAVTLLAAALLLNWAWQLLQPLLPVLLIVAVLAILGSLVLRRSGRW